MLRREASGTLPRSCLREPDAFVHVAEEDQEPDRNSSGYKLYDPVFQGQSVQINTSWLLIQFFNPLAETL